MVCRRVGLTRAVRLDTMGSMTEVTIPTIKKTTRTRKVAAVASTSINSTFATPQPSNLNETLEAFTNLLEKINKTKGDFERLQKEMSDTREGWVKEQRQHHQEVMDRNQEKELARKREQETYEYEMSLQRKKADDEFADKKAKWEKELTERKEEIAADKKELAELRKQVTAFEEEKEKAVKEASNLLTRELTGRFETENKLQEQEYKAEKEILALKIETLTSENQRQTKEIESLKRALEEATRQIKEVAVKVIEAGSSKTSNQEPGKMN